jgi:hypothetical protein
MLRSEEGRTLQERWADLAISAPKPSGALRNFLDSAKDDVRLQDCAL